MDIHPIRTPTDFGQTMSPHGHTVEHWYAATPEWEPEIRQTIAQVFDDLPYISTDEPGMVTAYLEGIEEPIRRLAELRLQIFAIPTTGTMEIQTADGPQRMPWRQTTYGIAPPTAVFRAGDGRRKCRPSRRWGRATPITLLGDSGEIPVVERDPGVRRRPEVERDQSEGVDEPETPVVERDPATSA